MAPQQKAHKPYPRPFPRRQPRPTRIAGILMLSLCLLSGFTATAYAHGGKTHKQGDVAAFKVLQTAMALYDRLLAHGKLDESWETGLVRVEISPPEYSARSGYTVSFQRSSGEPSTVYFFLTPTGEYAGSNFTGP